MVTRKYSDETKSQDVLREGGEAGSAFRCVALRGASVLLALVALSHCAVGESVSSSEDSIVGGEVDKDHPSVVALADDEKAFCTGTLVSPRVVLSAAHCAKRAKRVLFGPRISRPISSVRVVREYVHPLFEKRNLSNDLLLLELEAAADVEPSPLFRGEVTNSPSFVGSTLVTVGFGVSDGEKNTGFGVKRVVRFPLLAVGPADVGGSVGTIDGTQFYYRSPDRNTCDGDSGGPSFIVRDGVEYVVGVTSYGDKDCKVDGVNQRTDAPQIARFLQNTIDRIEQGARCINDGRCDAGCSKDGVNVDPDCAANHCKSDNVCSLSCVRDVDCTSTVPLVP